MQYHPKRRDAAEALIKATLEAAGASVEQLDGRGRPDLLVGYQRRTELMEVKDPELGDRNARSKGKRVTNPTAVELGLRDAQGEWWEAWQGKPPIVVTTPEEALAAIGIGAGSAASSFLVQACREVTKHREVKGTGYCACHHAMYG